MININRPLLKAVISLLFGIAAYLSGLPYPVMAAISLIWAGTIFYFLKKNILRFRIFILLLLFLAGYFNSLIRDTYDEKQISSYIATGESVCIEGVIDSVKISTYSVRLMLKSCTCNGEGLLNNVIIEWDTDAYSRGDRIVAYGVIDTLEGAENPGGFDERNYYNSLGYGFCLKADSVELLRANESMVIKWAESVKSKLEEVYSDICTAEDAGVFKAMLLGDKSEMDKELKTLYSDSGIGHVLAISGLHISIIGMGLYRLLRKPGIPYPLCALISGSFIIFYGIMTGNSVSTIRAIIMFVCAVYAQVIGRTYDILSAVSLSAIIILLINPFMLTNSGFQLSFMAIVGITVINMGFGKKKVQNITSGLAVQLATLSIILWNYYEVPVYSCILNLIVIPLMSYVMVSALAGGVLGLIWLTGGKFVIGTAHFILLLFRRLCAISLALPGSVYLAGRPGMGRVVLYFGLILVFALRYQIKAGIEMIGVRWKLSKGQGKLGKKQCETGKKICISGANLLKNMAAGFSWVSPFIVVAALAVLLGRNHSGMEITFLSVGQGDGIYIELPDGTNMFIDGGSSSKSKLYSNVISPFLKYKDVKQLDYLVFTHNDLDHYSGWLEYVQEYAGELKISNLVLNRVDYQVYVSGMVDENTDNGLWYIAELLADTGTQVKTMDLGDKYVFDTVEIISLNSAGSASENATTQEGSENEDSLVLLIRMGEYEVLFTGDIGEAQEQIIEERLRKVVGADTEWTLDVLKVAHHGSKYSSCEDFIAYLKPEAAVISYGANNYYGHPHEEVLERLEMAGSDIYKTGTGGAVIVEFGEEIKIYEYRK